MNRFSKYFRLFLEDDADTSGGGAGGEGGGNTPPPNPPPSNLATIDPSALAKEFGGVIAEQFKQQQQNQPKAPPTPEQIAEAKKQLKFWNPTKEFIAKFGNLETQEQAFGELRDGLFEQFSTVSNVQMAALKKEIMEHFKSQFEPVQQLLTQREEAEREARFHSTYPTLNNPQLKPLLATVATQLAAAGKFNGLSEPEAFDLLAKGVESVIKVTNADFSLGAATPQNNNQRSSNSIGNSSAGSGGGAGAGAGVKITAGKPIAAQILGPVRTKG